MFLSLMIHFITNESLNIGRFIFEQCVIEGKKNPTFDVRCLFAFYNQHIAKQMTYVSYFSDLQDSVLYPVVTLNQS